MARVKPECFSTVISALPIELLRNLSSTEYLINIKIEKMLLILWGNFYIKFHRNSQRAFTYIIKYLSILSGDSLYKSLLQNTQRYCFRDIHPNQFQIDSRYRQRFSRSLHLSNILNSFEQPPPSPALDFVFNSKVRDNQ